MNTAGKRVAWLSILGAFFLGCYSSTLIDPTGKEKGEIYARELEYVVTKDGKKYPFDNSMSIVNDTIVKTMKRVESAKLYEEVTIPLSDVAQVGESNPETIDSVDANTGAKYVFFKRPPAIEYVVTKTGAKYVFVEPPTIVNKAVVGEAKIVERGKTDVSIPLSDVAELAGGSFHIESVVTKTGAKYIFDEPPAIVNKAVIGAGRLVEEAKLTEERQVKISIPLSDVREVCVSEFRPFATGLLVGGIIAVAAIAAFFLPAAFAGEF